MKQIHYLVAWAAAMLVAYATALALHLSGALMTLIAVALMVVAYGLVYLVVYRRQIPRWQRRLGAKRVPPSTAARVAVGSWLEEPPGTFTTRCSCGQMLSVAQKPPPGVRFHCPACNRESSVVDTAVA